MHARNLFLVTILAALTSGCFGNPIIDPDDPLADGLPRRDLLFTNAWAGSTTSDHTFDIGHAYDYLTTDWAHTGHAFGSSTYTDPDGRAMDQAPASMNNGPIAVSRLLPPAVGTATVTFPATMNGAGTYTVTGVANIRPVVLLAATWTERYDGFGPFETTIRFHVPAGIDQMQASMAATGSYHAGMKLTGPDGATEFTIGPGSTGASASTLDAAPGLWTLHLAGPYRGGFTVTLTAL